MREIGAASTYLERILPSVGGYLKRLFLALDDLGPGAREAFVVVRRERQKHTQESRDAAWAALFETALDDDALVEILERVEAAYERLVGNAARSSASVEHLHSRLAPYVAVSDRLSQERWNLVAVRLNGTPFREGRRVGKSPLQILGVAGDEHWSEVLVAPMRRLFPGAMAYLLAHGCLPSDWTPESEAAAPALARAA